MSKSMTNEAVQYAIDSVIRSPSVDVYSYLCQARSTTGDEDDVKEMKRMEAKKEKETVPKVQEEIAEEMEGKEEKMVKAKEEVVEEIKETVQVTAADQGKRMELKEAVDEGIRSVVGSKCIDVYDYFERQSLQVAKQQKTVSSAVEDIKEHAQLLAGAISHKNTKEVKEEVMKLSESVKVAATTAGAAASAGIASVISSEGNHPDSQAKSENKERSGLENLRESVRHSMSHTMSHAQHIAADVQRQLPVIEGQVKESVHHYIEKATPATQKMMQSVSEIQNKWNLKQQPEESMDSTGDRVQSTKKDKKDRCKIM